MWREHAPYEAALEIFQPVNAGDPLIWADLVRIDVVHAGCIPCVAADGSQHRGFRQFVFCVRRGSKFGDGKGADLLAVDGNAILGEANRMADLPMNAKTRRVPGAQDEHPAARAGNALVAGNDRAGRMLGPCGERIGGRVEPQRVMLIRSRTGEEPPFAIEKEDRWVCLSARKNVFDGGPLGGEFSGAIKADGVGAERFSDHINVAVPFENVWIRKMKRFTQDDLPVVPGERVAADGEPDFAKIVGAVHHLEEEVPDAVRAKHEWICDEARRNIGDGGGGERGITASGSGSEMKR